MSCEPSSPNASLERAYEQLAEGRFEEAVESFSALVKAAPSDARAARGRAVAYVQLKRWSLAAADFAAARDAAPDDAENWIDLGISLAMDDQIYPAIDVFEELLAKQPECVRAHLELGLLHLRLGAIPKGRQQLEKALSCHPTLAQRRLIESVLHEQQKLDRKRLYRPDFEALNRQQKRPPARSDTPHEKNG